MPPKFQISRDSQALYITVVAKDRLPVFKSDAIKAIACRAIDEAKHSGGFLLPITAGRARESGKEFQAVMNL